MRKKLLSLVLSTGLLAVILPATALAAPTFNTIKGTVYDGSHHVVNNALVTVICNSNVKKTHSASDGSYSVQYNSTKCPNGASVSVTVTKGHKGGEKNANVHGTTAVNVTIVDVTIPEFGLITAGAATLLGGAAFMVVRRRQLSDHQA